MPNRRSTCEPCADRTTGRARRLHAPPVLPTEAATFREAQASGPSARFVQAFWQSTGTLPATATHRVLPDACADFIFDFAGATGSARDATFVGTMTRAIVVPSPGRRDLFGIRFRPGAASLLWHLPMRDLCDDRAALNDLMVVESELIERLAETENFESRQAIAERWIETRLGGCEIETGSLALVAAFNARLEASAGTANLAPLVAWNERKFQRFFEATYGTTQATMRCFWRFEAARRTLLHANEQNLGALAAKFGYADQAHLSREFRRFAGLSISDWRADAAA